MKRLGPCAPAGLIAWAALSTTAAPAAADFAPQFRPTLEIARAAGPIQVDGELDDPGWRGAARATGFAEVEPGDQTEPPVRSEAWVAYDEANLYVALLAWDDPASVRASLSDRDNIWRDDYFGIMLDTYGDQSWGYEIFVNPLGIQGDLRLDSQADEDLSFDLVWESRGRVTGEGYRVELAIPFSSLRFPDRPEQRWRINFWRDHQRDLRRRYAWAAQDRNEPCFQCQWGHLTGIRDVRARRPVELIASAIGSQAGALADPSDPDSEFDDGAADGEAGLNLRYGLSSNASAELSVNPDFSQVESDAGQIDVNTTFALFFPERRPFFQEGSDLFGSFIDAVYTRSVNDPVVAGKLSGQLGRTRGVYLYARDARSPVILPRDERSHYLLRGESDSHILRVRRALREESFVGALLTDRRYEGGGSGTVAGLDAALRVRGNVRLEGQVLASRTEEPDDPAITAGLDPVTFDREGHTLAYDGESFGGSAVYASVERSGRVWELNADYYEYSPAFRTDNGFTNRNDYRQLSMWNGFELRPNRRWVTRLSPNVDVGRVWNTEGRFKDEWLRPEIWLDTRGQTQLIAQYLVSRERFGGQVFPGIRIWYLSLDSRFSELLGGGVNTRFGRGIYRDFGAPELADQEGWSVYARLKPSQRLEWQVDWDYARMESRITGEELFAGYILRNRLDYNFTRELFLRLVAEYDDFDRALSVEPLVTYRTSPFTVFYFGSNSRVRRYDAAPPPAAGDDRWKVASRQYFAKVQILFRL